MLKADDIIYCKKWWEIADYNYEGQDNLPAGIVCCDIQKIPEFFSKLNKNKFDSYTVISARSDYGLFYQREHPAYLDVSKAISLFIRPEQGYNDVFCPARIERDTCNLSDRYTIKCYSHTSHTFDNIPDNVKAWYVTNCGIREPRVFPIPFGISSKDAVEKLMAIRNSNRKDKLLYVNFQFYTSERMELFRFYKTYSNYTCKRDITFEEYLRDLDEHYFVLSPTGNGVDCYRNMESIYMGTVPILESVPALHFYASLNVPVVFSGSLINLSETDLTRTYKELQSREYNTEKIKFSYWKDRIKSGV